MGYREEYGPLLDSIVQEGDLIAMKYFRAVEMRVDRKGDEAVKKLSEFQSCKIKSLP